VVRNVVRDASKFGAEITAGEVAEGIDLDGKLTIVIGGSGGIGSSVGRTTNG